jgi:hypothetical protein
LYLRQGELHIQRRVKVVSLSGNFRREGEVLFMEGVQGELDGLILGDISGVRIGKKLVLWEDPRNKRNPPTRYV